MARDAVLLVTPGVSNVSNDVSNTLFSDCNTCTSPRLVRVASARLA